MRNCMDWRSVAFDWNRARAFLVTAEEGSLSAAARALGVAQPTLSRQVAALERELGVALFERVGKGLALTETGLELLEHARTMGEAATRFSLAASGRAQSIEGTVRLSASEAFAAFILPPVLAALRRAAPGIEIELDASNTVTDLRRREADIALRNAQPTDPDLIARKLTDAAARLYATPACLDRLGNPTTPEALSAAPFIGFDDNRPFLEGLNARGFALTPASFPMRATSHLAHWALVKQGVGVGVMIETVGDADPDVVRALPDMAPMVFPVWLVTHRELKTSRRIRLVWDHLAATLGGPG